jgi:hypothetical protein
LEQPEANRMDMDSASEFTFTSGLADLSSPLAHAIE